MSVTLQSQNHKDLLDVVDKLRSMGIGRYVDLPQIIVCGDQSSGKSSVLEAISGLSFPTKDNLCTRFATELILRRSTESHIRISISPGHDRSDDMKAKLSAFAWSQGGFDLEKVVEQAKDLMGLNASSGDNFSSDILRIEMSGPSQPHLTIVDLPGLFLAGDKAQSAADSSIVKNLVLDYLKKPRSIILAVVSAKNDFALQQVTEHTRAIDPQGHRTLGLITKPDTLDKGSDSEQFYVDLASNKNVVIRLGWHVLRNRSYATRAVSTAERDAQEKLFFSQGIWTNLRPSQTGIGALRVRLSNVLRDQILQQLPSVLADVQVGLDECRLKLDRIGSSRSTLPDQTRYLLKTAKTFSNLIEAAVNGEYTAAFFRISCSDDRDSRLRALIQNLLGTFSKDMREKGQARVIVGDDPKSVDSSNRQGYMEHVKALIEKNRGRELPGTFNPMVVSEMFSEQCAPWKALTEGMIAQAVRSCEVACTRMMQHIVDEDMAETILSQVINPAMEEIKTMLRGKIDELLSPHIAGHPITYNHYLTDTIQKIQFDRLRRKLETGIERHFGAENMKAGVKFAINSQALLKSLEVSVNPDMTDHACDMAIDTMQAYYKVRRRLIVLRCTVLTSSRSR